VPQLDKMSIEMNGSGAEMDENSTWLIVASVVLMVQTVTMFILLAVVCIMARLYLISVPMIVNITKQMETIGGLVESWSNPVSILSGASLGTRGSNAAIRQRTTQMVANQTVEGCIVS
jgi:hypothetical protein